MFFRMFYVELKDEQGAEVVEEDEIDKSIKAIHQSAQKLSDSIVHLASGSQKLSNQDDEALSPTMEASKRK